MKYLLAALVAILMIPVAYAAVDVTYTFNALNVESLAYNCLDAKCTSVAPFSGEYIDGPNVDDGSITIRYPDALATPNGYVIFFVSDGYRPKYDKATWNTGGESGLADPQSVSLTFTQYPVTCRAPVSELIFVNQLQPNVPLIVNTTAQLDAQTTSAFQLITADVGYIPPAFKQKYYGADTNMVMEILKGSSVIHTQQQNYNYTNGNSIIASSKIPIQFIYLPSEAGNFTVRVTSKVVDNQCASNEDMNAQSMFYVLSGQPSSQFYTILNNLKINTTYVQPGNQLLVSYDKITNHVSGNSTFTPVQTDVEYIVTLGSSTVFYYNYTTFANPDAISPVTYSFNFTPTVEGVYKITVKGKARSVLPTANLEITDEESMLINVQGGINHTVTFQVKDSDTGFAISGATAELFGIGTTSTSSDGSAFFSTVPSGTYNYKISASGYSSKTSSVNVFTDKTIAVVLHANDDEGLPVNTPPIMDLPNTVNLLVNTNTSFNYHDYVFDDQDGDSDLDLTVLGGNVSIAVTINSATGIVTFLPIANFTGTETIDFMLADQGGMSVIDSVIVTVSGTSAPPVWGIIPEFETLEDSAAVRVFNLWDFVNDTDTPLTSLVFIVDSVTPSTLATARIEGGHYLSVYPRPNQNGLGTYGLIVTDGIGNATVNSTFNVTSVNDAPVVISVPRIPNINESTNFTLNLSLVFFDPDGDVLLFDVNPITNVTFMINLSGPSLIIIPDFNVNGTRTFNVTAIDPFGLSATATFTLYLNFVDDSPFFNMVIPNITTFEEVPNSLDLSPFENDPEDGPGGNDNFLTWKMQFANMSNLTPVTFLSNYLFDLSLNTSSDFLIVTPKPNATGSENITLYLFDSTGKNISQNITITVVNVNDAPVFVNLSNKTAEAGIVFYFDVNATDSDPTNDTLTFGLVNITPALAGFSISNATGEINFTPMSNGVFSITLQVCDFANCTNGTFTLTVTDSTVPTPDGQITPPNPSIYAPGANYTFIINWTDNGNITNVTFEFGGVNYTNVSQNGTEYTTSVTDFAVGNYTFKWFAKDGANNTNMSNSSIFTILQANSSLDLLLNGTAANITVAQGDNVTIFSNITNTTGNVSLFRNGALLGTGASPFSLNSTFPNAGLFNITATFAGSQNYTGSSSTLFVTVTDTTPPSFGTQTATPASPAMFTSLYNFKINVTDNVAVGTVTLEFDNTTNTTAGQIGNTSTYEANLTSLTVGNHTFKWFANDTTGNLNISNSTNYTVLPGIANITLLINGIAGNTSAQINDTVVFDANVTNPAGGFVELYLNGTLSASGSSPLSFNTSFPVFGTIPIMALFPGDANVSAGNITRFLTITPIIMQANITPVSGAVLNYSTFNLTLDTNGITTCKWSFADEAQATMNNSFTTPTGLNHSANVTNYTLGVFTMSAACNNQSAANNSDLTYTALNFLDNSTLVGANTITDTIMFASLLNGTTMDNVTGINNTLTNITSTFSIINNSILTDCTITNSTVKDIVASNCTFTDSYVDPSNLTGSTVIAVSTIVDSNVTFSNITNSTVTNSNLNISEMTICYVNNSRLNNVHGTNCNITNSTFNNAFVIDATIANGVILNGTITSAPNATYNASTGGPANVSTVIEAAPVASFTPTSGATAPGTLIPFTSTSTDANIPGPLNDSLTFFWDFGDGTNATNATPTKSYNATGTYIINLTVTDSFGMSSSATGTHSIATPPAPSGGGGSSGGGGGGGGGGGLPRIALTDVPVIRTITVGQPLQFTIDGKVLLFSVVMRRASGTDTEWLINGVTTVVPLGQNQLFDLSRDGIMDLDLKVLTIERSAGQMSFKRAGAPAVEVPPLPLFNFTATPKEQPKVVPVETEQTETEVPVEAEVKEQGPSFMQKVKDFFTIKLSSKSAAVKIGIVILVILIGLAAYALFVRWEGF